MKPGPGLEMPHMGKNGLWVFVGQRQRGTSLPQTMCPGMCLTGAGASPGPPCPPILCCAPLPLLLSTSSAAGRVSSISARRAQPFSEGNLLSERFFHSLAQSVSGGSSRLGHDLGPGTWDLAPQPHPSPPVHLRERTPLRPLFPTFHPSCRAPSPTPITSPAALDLA